MRTLADGIRAQNVRPGIWQRPLLTRKPVPDAWKLHNTLTEKDLRGGCVLDPTVPAVLDEVADMFRGLEAWGYELIKQDFSSFDILGRWGMQYGATLTDDGWAFADRTKTTAMAIKDLYDAMRRGVSDDTLLMGCNTFPHLSAGVFELSRTGDDTSGRFWERTRFMGVNTLAFRMPQHGIFQSCDADCVGLTRAVEWEKNALWLDVLARSGTPDVRLRRPRRRRPGAGARPQGRLRARRAAPCPRRASGLDDHHLPRRLAYRYRRLYL